MTTITALELRPITERFVTTRAGIQIGSAYIKRPRWQDAASCSRSKRRSRLADRAVQIGNAIALLFLAGLLIVERLT